MDRPVSINDYFEVARERLEPMVFDYFAGGAGDERTLRANAAAFTHHVLLPRVLRDVSEVDITTTAFGTPVSMPILVAPTAFQRMAHRDGELATARAAAEAGTIMTLSTIASTSIEDVAATDPDAPRWFQLYVYRDRDVTAELVKRAEASGYRALVLTVDTPVLGLRDRNERNRFVLPVGVELANLASLGAGVKLPRASGSGLFAWVNELQDASVTWEDLAWLRSLSPLPLIIKGVLTAEDARLAVEAGVDGIIVSNHGGRQLDGSPATLEVLPEVVEAAGDLEVWMDGGVRRGSDVLIALALGARGVLLGRPILWGLASGGKRGVSEVLELMRAEFRVAMQIAGCAAIGEVTGDLVRRADR